MNKGNMQTWQIPFLPLKYPMPISMIKVAASLEISVIARVCGIGDKGNEKPPGYSNALR